ncbi:hypothetical protein [Tsukamurella paurometabola]|uniref:Uncharacterized protein n=1 Tax=Tsukamurella paurometabola TaxID=2061 RepID=A0ABS5NDT0_TSUPA|nr:hypothetical protein [Tsukamurella paurometabola]MBS4102436.1 hypothetical protein [Tsukamurella paurometabola]
MIDPVKAAGDAARAWWQSPASRGAVDTPEAYAARLALEPLREAWGELYDYEDDAEVEAGVHVALERMEKLLFSAAEIEARQVAEEARAKERIRRLISRTAGQEVTFEWGTETT